ncbi:peptide chain release factor N(5)-glutamine methyltransferase [bacterium]|nr:peptide chain release factor N(5)-glutamine methyltransferase [bacterium]
MPQETVLSLIQKSTTFFAEKGIDEAKLSAEHLLAHVLGQKRLQMYLRFDQPVKEEELTVFRELVRRRLKHEPVQYIVGSTEFYGLEFKVTPDVLIPRPDTEHLIDTVLDFHKAGQLADDMQILDIGTGSGAIAIALAAQLPSIRVVATDISAAALAIASANAERNKVADRIDFVEHDIFTDNLPGGGEQFDIVASNPPYIPEADIATLQPEVRDFEPMIAATDGGDGLRFYRRIVKIAPGFLKTGGLLLLEVGAGQAQTVAAMLTDANMQKVHIREDYGGIERVVSAWKG